jgi:integrase
MARHTKFEPVETENGWRLNVPPKYSETGKRERHYYKTQKAALEAKKAFKKKLETFGAQARAIKPSLAENAHAAEKLLSGTGVTLLEAVNFYLEAKKRETASKTVSEAIHQWMENAATTELKTATIANYRGTAKRFEPLGDRIISTLTRDELQETLCPSGMTATSANGHYTRGLAFWNWCARRGWCEAELLKMVDRPKKRGRKKIEFLSVDDTRALLNTAVEFYPKSVAMFAVGTFAGVRPAELARLSPADVACDGIDVGSDESKGESRRHITPCPTLAAWLKKYPFEEVANWDRVWDAVRRLAGWNVASELADSLVKANKLEKLPPITRGKWPQDAMRHSCGTYTVARGENLANMAFWFGHTGGTATLRTYYVGKVKMKSALEFFAIVPKGAAKPKKFQTVKGAA